MARDGRDATLIGKEGVDPATGSDRAFHADALGDDGDFWDRVYADLGRPRPGAARRRGEKGGDDHA